MGRTLARTNIILLATYWNEADWIEASLAQIERIDPIEAIICDGNFDPRVENRSTDGTRTIIEQFVKESRIPCRMISAVRVERNMWKGLRFFREAGCPGARSWTVGRMRMAAVTQLMMNIYRVNQALTFAHMCRLSEAWREGRWVMTCDADQFYTDELIDAFSVTKEDGFNCDLITADELTFPFGFDEFTSGYEIRKWNNLPHRIKRNMAIYPTRHFMVETLTNTLNYQDNFKRLHGGVYHHYKFRRDPSRLEKGYQLGDRRPPDPQRYEGLQSAQTVQFPSVIREKYPEISKVLRESIDG